MTHDSFSIPEHTTLNPKAYAIYQLSCLITSPSATLDTKAATLTLMPAPVTVNRQSASIPKPQRLITLLQWRRKRRSRLGSLLQWKRRLWKRRLWKRCPRPHLRGRSSFDLNVSRSCSRPLARRRNPGPMTPK